jgi:uncharacterized protein YqgC (DUF456 family)
VFEQFVQTMKSPEVGGVMVVLSVLLVADFVTGVTRAVRLGVFEWDVIADFIGTHVIGRWLGLVVLVALQPLSDVLVPVLGLAVAAYTAESLASIRTNIGLARNPEPGDA